MPTIIEKIAYKYDELNADQKKKALQKQWDINVDYEWWDFIEEEAITIAKIMGIEIDRIYFSGFSSQGDGACFEGNYAYAKGATKQIKAYAPNDAFLIDIATRLQALQRKHFYRLSCNVEHRGHYYHSLCTSFNVYNNGEWASAESEEDLKQIIREFMDWIYSRLDREYYHLTSREAVEDTLIANEYLFYPDGNIA